MKRSDPRQGAQLTQKRFNLRIIPTPVNTDSGRSGDLGYVSSNKLSEFRCHAPSAAYDYYIANGEFIAGAIAAGFKHHCGPNACFNMSTKSLREQRLGKTELCAGMAGRHCLTSIGDSARASNDIYRLSVSLPLVSGNSAARER